MRAFRFGKKTGHCRTTPEMKDIRMTHGDPPIQPCSPDQTRCRRAHLFPLILLFVLLTVIYFNSFQGTWVFDDEPNIVQNQRVHLERLDRESIINSFYGIQGDDIKRPLSYLSFGLNYFFHGMDTWGYHLVNFSIHCLASLFLYLFIFHTLHLPGLREKYAGRAGSVALLAAALWATSPIHVTAVTYIVQRMASMAALFFIMSMFFYLMARTTPGWLKKISWFVLCVVSGVLAVASKENAAMLPIVIYLFDLLLIQGVSGENVKRHLRRAAIPISLFVVLAFVLANPLGYFSEAAYAHREFTLLERLLTQPRILVHYLSLMLYPMTDRFALIHEVRLSTDLFTPWTTLLAIGFWCAWSFIGVLLAKRQPLIAFCMLFFIVNHLVESSVIPLELIYEHRNYLPSMALFFLVSIAVIAFIRDFSRKRLLHVLTAALILITIFGHGHTVIQRNSLFEHPLYLWADNVEKAPGLSRVHTNLGKAYNEVGQHEAAKKSYINAIEADRYHRPSLRAVPLLNLGIYYLEEGSPENAKKLFAHALESDPGNWQARVGMTSALLILGELEQARGSIEAAVESAPENTRFRALYSLVLLKQGEYDRSIQEAFKLVGLSGAPAKLNKVLGEVYAQLGEYQRAQKYWKKYLENDPGDAESLLALVYLAHLRDDENELREAAIRVLARKGSDTWEQFFKKARNAKKVSVFSEDTLDLLPLIKDGVTGNLKAMDRGGQNGPKTDADQNNYTKPSRKGGFTDR